ncbi:MAG: outer membrane beta-barrel protein [Cyclobacterium sp.]|uniref:outer membrane beta-barrel protein n=1 Tax=unclassified Cyclobacterium TaxID=2615055 RepID=UPI0013D1BE13|nr:outer membrane beta-barrel protein [Cyclobacterium sp. SYSU L10401]
MIKQTFIAVLFMLLSWKSMAQEGVNQINLGFDAGITLNEYYQTQFPAGFGASIKGLYGLGLNGQVSLTGNYLYFPLDPAYILPTGENLSLHLIPVLAGYRLNFEPFFFEPQVGGTLFINHYKNEPNSYSESNIEFSFAAELGYMLNNVELSLRYQHAGPSPFQMAFLGIRAAYIIPFGL